MNISERDIFDFVFSQQDLDEEKLLFIKKNRDQFKDKIELTKSTLDAFNNEAEYTMPAGLIKAIKAGRNYNKISLQKVVIKENNSNGIVRLAADSPKFEKKLSVDTFIDKNQEYIVKVISQEDAANVYVFKNDNSPMENFSLELLPSGKVLHYQNNSIPMQIEHQSAIENVELYVE